MKFLQVLLAALAINNVIAAPFDSATDVANFDDTGHPGHNGAQASARPPAGPSHNNQNHGGQHRQGQRQGQQGQQQQQQQQQQRPQGGQNRGGKGKGRVAVAPEAPGSGALTSTFAEDVSTIEARQFGGGRGKGKGKRRKGKGKGFGRAASGQGGAPPSP